MPRLRRPRSPVHLARRVAAALLASVALAMALRAPPVPASARAPDVVAVAVAAHDLPAGAATGRESLLRRVLAAGVRAREPITDARLVGAGLTALLPEGQVAAPVRLADVAVAALVRTGDRVDVLATPADATATDVVAAGALVLAASGADEESGAGLLLIAVDKVTAARLAAAATTATLTVNLPPP